MLPALSRLPTGVSRVAAALAGTALAVSLTSLAGCSGGDDRPAAESTAPARATGTPTAANSRYDDYVALGDSYTAAPLVPPTDASTICLRSGGNYPALVTRELPGTTLTDVSCSGASTSNMTQPQHGHGGTVPPQFSALRRGTDLVTVGIGGNDFGLFGTLVVRCTQLGQRDPSGAPCRAAMAGSGSDRLAEALRRIGHNVADVVRGIRERSPHARILVVGYPQIVPASGSCPDLLPLAAGDYPYARQVNRGLAEAVRAGARRAGAEYVDVWAASTGHDICSADPWINGRVTSADRALAYHPLAPEQQAVARLVLRQLSR